MAIDDPVAVPDRARQLDPTDRRRALDAARAVLRSQGPDRTTLKWVARESGISHAAIAGEWADVGELLSAVLDDLADQLDERLDHNFEPFDDTRDVERTQLVEDYMQIAIRGILDGTSPARAQSRFPLTEHLVSVALAAGADERTARYRVCHSLVLEWGWRLLGEHLLIACGLEEESMADATAELHAVQASLRRLPLVTPPPPPGHHH